MTQVGLGSQELQDSIAIWGNSGNLEICLLIIEGLRLISLCGSNGYYFFLFFGGGDL